MTFEPSSVKDLEMSIVSYLFRQPDVYESIAPIITKDVFSVPFLGEIYGYYAEAKALNTPIGFDVVSQKIMADRHYDPDRTAKYMSQIIAASSDVILDAEIERNAREKALALSNAWKANKAREIIDQARINPGDITDTISTLIDSLGALQTGTSNVVRNIGNIVNDNKDDYFVEHDVVLHKLGICSELDRWIGGLDGGDVIVIGARPAVGKSAFVQQIAMNLVKQQMKVGFFSLEMPEKQMYQRLMSSISGISMQRIRSGNYFSGGSTGDEKRLWTEANEKLLGMSNYLYFHFGSVTVPEIRQKVKAMKYDVIIIDYLQLVRATDRYKGSRVNEVGEISKGLKSIAMDMNIPVILLSQLNRGSEYSDAKEPTMADLRESGDIEQDASIVMLMWNMDAEKKYKAVKVDKNRMGESGSVVLEFDGQHMHFGISDKKTKDFKPDKQTGKTRWTEKYKNGGQNSNGPSFKPSSDSYVVKGEEKAPWEE